MKYDFCKFKNSMGESPAQLTFYGDIVSDSWSAWTSEDQYPLNVQELLREIGDSDIDIHINSGGGDVFAGTAICNMLRNTAGKKTVYVDGLAASIASVIAMAGDEIIIPSNAYLMIHKASSIGWGNSDDMRALADTLDKIDGGIVATYMTRAADGVTEKQIKKMMAAETWLTGKEAAEIFKNVTAGESVAAVAGLDSKMFSAYKNMPQNVVKRNKPFDNVGKPQQTDVPKDMEKYAKYLNVMRAAYDD